MTNYLVTQVRFARSEFMRCLEGLEAADAERRLPPSNSIAWIIGHLASHEQWFLVEAAQEGRVVVPGLYDRLSMGRSMSEPDYEEMRGVWRMVTEAADDFLDGIDAEMLDTHIGDEGILARETLGSSLLRLLFHYWFHLGEAHALRQQMGHEDLPQFVGQIAGVEYR